VDRDAADARRSEFIIFGIDHIGRAEAFVTRFFPFGDEGSIRQFISVIRYTMKLGNISSVHYVEWNKSKQCVSINRLCGNKFRMNHSLQAVIVDFSRNFIVNIEHVVDISRPLPTDLVYRPCCFDVSFVPVGFVYN